MAANTNPIFTLTGRASWGTASLSTGTNTAKDGTGTMLPIFTAKATDGSFVQRIRFKCAGTTTSATVCRIFINNGASNATAANNILFDEITLPVTTLTETAATPVYEIPCNFVLPGGYVLNACIGTSTGTGGWYVSVIGGDY